ncbi:hypothetical protein [Arthrobacter sp. efr-133-TYG-118]|uniref:hypothetical protein n=1 Tax=Arthrobacter sp. efr-133-TYG-118 TaxID=3040279 RepID=UPI00254C295B|nr:hypothetical protein [Arthrobacter sp. efr-133-TYG-118]
MAMIFISPVRELLGSLWIGYPAIVFAFSFLGASAIHRHDQENPVKAATFGAAVSATPESLAAFS